MLVNSRYFTLFHKFSHVFTKYFILLVWTNNAQNRIASHRLIHKKPFVLKTIHVTSSYRKNKRFFVKKPMRGYFWLCLPSIPVKKKDFVKKCENLWIHANSIHVNSREKAWKSVNLAALYVNNENFQFSENRVGLYLPSHWLYKNRKILVRIEFKIIFITT
jgi:hypothetical protein